MPLTLEGSVSVGVSPDGRSLAAQLVDRTWQVMSMGGLEARTVPGLAPDESPIAWSQDSKAVFVQSGVLPVRLDRVDVASGTRTHLKTLAPPDPTGVLRIDVTSVINDGRHYAYYYWRHLSTLHTISGIR